MAKTLAITLALLLTLSMSAAAETVKGTVQSVDRSSHSFVLEDGTQLSASDSYLNELTPGQKVEAVYEVQGGQKIVTDLERRAKGSEGSETTNFGTRNRDNITINWDSID